MGERGCWQKVQILLIQPWKRGAEWITCWNTQAGWGVGEFCATLVWANAAFTGYEARCLEMSAESTAGRLGSRTVCSGKFWMQSSATLSWIPMNLGLFVSNTGFRVRLPGDVPRDAIIALINIRPRGRVWRRPGDLPSSFPRGERQWKSRVGIIALFLHRVHLYLCCYALDVVAQQEPSWPVLWKWWRHVCSHPNWLCGPCASLRFSCQGWVWGWWTPHHHPLECSNCSGE